MTPASSLVAEAQARLADGDVAGAASLLDRALAADAGDPAALFARARIHLMAGEPAGAQDLLRRGRRSDPSSAPMAFLHGLSLHVGKQARAAAEAFAEAVRLAPDHRDAALFLTRSLRAAGDMAGCRAARDALLARLGDDARLLNEVASDLIEEGDEPAAAALLERALALAPGTPEIEHNLGVACARMGLIETAEHLLRTALASRPEAAATEVTLAEVLRKRGRTDEAAERARTLLIRGAEMARAHGVLGTIGMDGRDHEAGLAHLAASQAAEPDSLPALWNLACALNEAGPAGQAERHLAEIAARPPSGPRERHIVSEAGWRLRLLRGEPGPAERLLRVAALADLPAGAPTPVGDVVELEDAALYADHWHLLRGDGGQDGTLLPDLVFHLPIAEDGFIVRFGRTGKALAPRDVPVQEVDEPGLFLGGAHNYYHWLTDYLPRLAADEAQAPWRDLPLVVNSHLTPYQRRSLELLGIDPARLRPARAGAFQRFRRLAVPRLPGRAFRPGGEPEWMRPTLTPRTMEWLDRRFARHAVPERGSPRRIMLLRGESAFRRCENEAQIAQVARQHGFEPVRAETLDFERQIALFAGAEAVLAVHGAGCTNMLFAPRGACLIELHPAGHLPGFYVHLTRLRGQEHKALGGPPTRAIGTLTPHHWAFRVDPAQLDALLAELPRR